MTGHLRHDLGPGSVQTCETVPATNEGAAELGSKLLVSSDHCCYPKRKSGRAGDDALFHSPQDGAF